MCFSAGIFWVTEVRCSQSTADQESTRGSRDTTTVHMPLGAKPMEVPEKENQDMPKHRKKKKIKIKTKVKKNKY